MFNLKWANLEDVWDYKNSWSIWFVLSLFISMLLTKLCTCTSSSNYVKRDSWNSAITLFQKLKIIQSYKKSRLFLVYCNSLNKNTML